MNVYISDLSSFLPNAPIPNAEMETCLGMIGEMPSRTKRLILKHNGIQTRHYAIDPVSGEMTHTNAELTAEAVRGLNPHDGFALAHIECLSTGTSTPDQFFPGHASMVHGELGTPPCETASSIGVCLSGMTALKYAFMSVANGLTSNAVATGSELSSSYLRASYAGAAFDAAKAEDLEKRPFLAFGTDFLRWMLSDCAGAAFLTAAKPVARRALRIDWFEVISFAGEMETCMLAGGVKNADGTVRGWRNFTPAEMMRQDVLTIKQDVKLLNKDVIRITVEEALPHVLKKHSVTPDDFAWFLPHYSSEYFRKPLGEGLASAGFAIPYDKWFENLRTKGNVGSASIYILLEELFKSDRLNEGDRLLCYVPESARFSVCYMALTVV